MPFYHGYNPVPIRRKVYAEDGQYLRFNHARNTWERSGAGGWCTISVSLARFFFDKGWKLWDSM